MFITEFGESSRTIFCRVLIISGRTLQILHHFIESLIFIQRNMNFLLLLLNDSSTQKIPNTNMIFATTHNPLFVRLQNFILFIESFFLIIPYQVYFPSSTGSNCFTNFSINLLPQRNSPQKALYKQNQCSLSV